MVSCSAFPLTMPIIWVAILLYDYCLTFVTEVESCWVVRRLSWGLGFFYLNRYLVLFGHIPIMMEFFWPTSNPNKTEVSILVLRQGGKMLMCNLRCWYSSTLKMAMKCNDIFWPVVTTCSRFTNPWPSSFRWSLVVSLFFPTSFGTMLIYFSLNIGMLIMRMYALYERSRKVLALYIGVGVVIVIMGCVSLSLRGNHTQSDIPLSMLWYNQWAALSVKPPNRQIHVGCGPNLGREG